MVNKLRSLQSGIGSDEGDKRWPGEVEGLSTQRFREVPQNILTSGLKHENN